MIKSLRPDCVRMLQHKFALKHAFSTVQADPLGRDCSGYEAAITALNGLQSNASTIQKSSLAFDKRQHGEKSISDARRFLQHSEFPEEDLDKLSIIHVAGTKGKGSTCAFTESILRSFGFKTGFYSSPHLIAVRERIRINGVPLEKDVFSEYFWRIYNKLNKNQQHENDMPPYFKFLTLMAFHIFLEMKVDVAVIEVGVGGEYDCTNVIRKPVVCGVSSLGIDHTNVLGNTIQEIAWNKGGIFKPGAPAFTVPQPKDAMKVLMERATERNTNLQLCPDLSTYDWDRKPIMLGLAGSAQYLNATLALQLCQTWMEKTAHGGTRSLKIPNNGNTLTDCPPFALPFKLSKPMFSGLQKCCWPGRSQTLRRDSVTYFLDGAHTAESIMTCIDWFKDHSFSKSSSSIFRVLIYNSTGSRDPGTHLIPLSSVDFDLVIFCPNLIDKAMDYSSDQKNVNNPEIVQLNKCTTHQQYWSFLMSSKNEHPVAPSIESSFEDKNELSHSKEIPSYLFPCIKDALTWAVGQRDCNFHEINKSIPRPVEMSTADNLHVLVTGSLHLVGGVLAIIDPELTSSLQVSVPS